MANRDLSLLLENTIGVPIEYEGRIIKSAEIIDVHGTTQITINVLFSRGNYRRAIVLDLSHFTGKIQPLCKFVDKSDEPSPRLIIWVDTFPFAFDCLVHLEKGFVSIFSGVDIFNDKRACVYNFKNNALLPVKMEVATTLYLCNDFCSESFSEMLFTLRMQKNPNTRQMSC